MSREILNTELAADATEDQLVETAQLAVSRCNWLIGECAARWTERYAKGRTDADFAELVGLSGDQVYQRRRVWEEFADVQEEYGSLRWSHFYAATNWQNAPECLAWAEEMGATVAEMKAWRRASQGEDLTLAGEEGEIPFEANIAPLEPSEATIHGAEFAASEATVFGEGGTARVADPEMASAARATEGDDYAPFGKGARGSAPTEAAPEIDEPVRALAVLKKVAATFERLDRQLTPAVLAAASDVPDDVRQRLLDGFEKVSSKVAEL